MFFCVAVSQSHFRPVLLSICYCNMVSSSRSLTSSLTNSRGSDSSESPELASTTESAAQPESSVVCFDSLDDHPASQFTNNHQDEDANSNNNNTSGDGSTTSANHTIEIGGKPGWECDKGLFPLSLIEHLGVYTDVDSATAPRENLVDILRLFNPSATVQIFASMKAHINNTFRYGARIGGDITGGSGTFHKSLSVAHSLWFGVITCENIEHKLHICLVDKDLWRRRHRSAAMSELLAQAFADVLNKAKERVQQKMSGDEESNVSSFCLNQCSNVSAGVNHESASLGLPRNCFDSKAGANWLLPGKYAMMIFEEIDALLLELQVPDNISEVNGNNNNNNNNRVNGSSNDIRTAKLRSQRDIQLCLRSRSFFSVSTAGIKSICQTEHAATMNPSRVVALKEKYREVCDNPGQEQEAAVFDCLIEAENIVREAVCSVSNKAFIVKMVEEKIYPGYNQSLWGISNQPNNNNGNGSTNTPVVVENDNRPLFIDIGHMFRIKNNSDLLLMFRTDALAKCLGGTLKRAAEQSDPSLEDEREYVPPGGDDNGDEEGGGGGGGDGGGSNGEQNEEPGGDVVDDDDDDDDYLANNGVCHGLDNDDIAELMETFGNVESESSSAEDMLNRLADVFNRQNRSRRRVTSAPSGLYGNVNDPNRFGNNSTGRQMGWMDGNGETDELDLDNGSVVGMDGFNTNNNNRHGPRVSSSSSSSPFGGGQQGNNEVSGSDMSGDEYDDTQSHDEYSDEYSDDEPPYIPNSLNTNLHARERRLAREEETKEEELNPSDVVAEVTQETLETVTEGIGFSQDAIDNVLLGALAQTGIDSISVGADGASGGAGGGSSSADTPTLAGMETGHLPSLCRKHVYESNHMFGSHTGNVYTGAPFVGMESSAETGNRLQLTHFPPLGPCAGHGYMSGEKNNHLCYVKGVKPSVFGGFGASVAALLTDTVAITGSYEYLQQSFLHKLAVYVAQSEREDLMKERNRPQSPHKNSHHTARLEFIVCVNEKWMTETQNGGNDAIGSTNVPWVSGIMGCLVLDSKHRVSSSIADNVNRLLKPLVALQCALNGQHSATTNTDESGESPDTNQPNRNNNNRNNTTTTIPFDPYYLSNAVRCRLVVNAALLEMYMNRFMPLYMDHTSMFRCRVDVTNMLDESHVVRLSQAECDQFHVDEMDGLLESAIPRAFFNRNNNTDLPVYFPLFYRYRKFKEENKWRKIVSRQTYLRYVPSTSEMAIKQSIREGPLKNTKLLDSMGLVSELMMLTRAVNSYGLLTELPSMTNNNRNRSRRNGGRNGGDDDNDDDDDDESDFVSHPSYIDVQHDQRRRRNHNHHHNRHDQLSASSSGGDDDDSDGLLGGRVPHFVLWNAEQTETELVRLLERVRELHFYDNILLLSRSRFVHDVLPSFTDPEQKPTTASFSHVSSVRELLGERLSLVYPDKSGIAVCPPDHGMKPVYSKFGLGGRGRAVLDRAYTDLGECFWGCSDEDFVLLLSCLLCLSVTLFLLAATLTYLIHTHTHRECGIVLVWEGHGL